MATRAKSTKPAETDVEAVEEEPVELEEVEPAPKPVERKRSSKPSRAEIQKQATRAALERELAGYEQTGRDDRAAAVRESLEAL